MDELFIYWQSSFFLNLYDFSMRKHISQDPYSSFFATICVHAWEIIALLRDFICYRGVRCNGELGTGINLTKSGIHLIFIFVIPATAYNLCKLYCNGNWTLFCKYIMIGFYLKKPKLHNVVNKETFTNLYLWSVNKMR